MSDPKAFSDDDPGPGWDELIGPFYKSETLADSMGISETELQARTDSQEYLVTVTSDEVSIYPAFQFDENMKPLPHLAELYEILDVFLPDGWSKAFWLNLSKGALYDKSPAEVLRGHDWLAVFKLANHELHRHEN